jgi:hypothetical protein
MGIRTQSLMELADLGGSVTRLELMEEPVMMTSGLPGWEIPLPDLFPLLERLRCMNASPVLRSPPFVHLLALEVLYDMDPSQERTQGTGLEALHEGIENDIFPSLKALKITTIHFSPFWVHQTFQDYSQWTMQCEKFRRLCKRRRIEIDISEAPVVLEDRLTLV